ncbi:MAG: FtsK/SpoIIIE domain-containing protein [Lachnospiraceae bacterium]|nr:FtsK/SpoIIIE domain-containing protein [Lachnospiraceae bacterium]
MKKRKAGSFLYTSVALSQCIQMIIENDRKKANRALYNRAMAEAEARRAAACVAPPVPMYKPYIFPEIHGNLTYHRAWATRDIKAEGETVIEVLKAYNIYCELTDINQGPTLTQYIITPRIGQPVQKILKLEKEFQAALHCNATLRFDNGCVFLEVPIGTSRVYLGDLLIDDQFQSSDRFTMAIGMGVDGSKHYIDIEKACHILISGMTGSGKSIVLHNLIISLLMKQTPDRMHLYMIDPKGSEFGFYNGLNACTVLSTPYQAIDLLDNLCAEMDRRYNVLAANGCRDIDNFNAKFPAAPMRRDIVIIDELSDLMYMSGKTVESSIVRIAQKARACGIHLIIATQYPIAKVVTGLIKANMPTKICLRVGTTTNSMVALDMPGGEKLMGHGDMLFLPNGALTPTRLQGGYVSEMEINNIAYALSKNQ